MRFSKNKTRFYAVDFAPDTPIGTHGVGRMRKHGLEHDGLLYRPRGAARNASGATFAGTSFRTLAF